MKSPATLFAYQTMTRPKRLNSSIEKREKFTTRARRLQWVKRLLLLTWR